MVTLTRISAAQDGVGIVELLVALLLGSLLMAMSLPALRLSRDVYFKVRDREDLEMTLFLASNAIKQGVAASRALYAIPSLRIHKAGEIRDVYGKRTVVHWNTPSLEPDRRSDAISFLVLKSELMFRVLKQSGNGSSSAEIKLCLENTLDKNKGSQREIREIDSWIGIGIDGASEYGGVVRVSKKRHSDCSHGTVYSGRFRYKKRQLFVKSGTEFERAGMIYLLSLIPIKDSYALYVARNGQLRRMSHITRENQAIASGIRQLSVEETAKSNNTIDYNVTVELLKGNEKRTFGIYHRNPESQSVLDVVL